MTTNTAPRRKVSSHTINRRLFAAMIGGLIVMYSDLVMMWTA